MVSRYDARSIGETSKLAILIGAVILLWTGIASWRIMLSVFAGGYLMGLLFNLIGLNAYMDIPALLSPADGWFRVRRRIYGHRSGNR